jgi:penicillin-binding protein 2
MKGKIGSIVAIEPSTGEVLCMVSAPSYDPRGMIGKQRSKTHQELGENPFKPLLNRAIMGQYPPGSTFKPSQALTFLTEGTLTPHTPLPCNGGFNHRGLHVGCHAHPSPISLTDALSTSCNGYFCWGLYYMMGKHKYGSLVNAMNKWRDYMVSMGFGYKLGIDLPGEKRGMIPNGAYYNEVYRHSWGALSVISISIGQGEVNLTPLQIANLGATIANRGYYYIPHVVRQIEGASIDSIYTERHRTKAATWAYQWVVRGMRQSAISGTCKALSRLPFSACGKTGTAQNKGHDHSVFMGFAPMDNPRIAVAVYVENGGFGADFGVPIGALVMEKYIKGKLSPDSEVRARDFENRSIYYSSESR